MTVVVANVDIQFTSSNRDKTFNQINKSTNDLENSVKGLIGQYTQLALGFAGIALTGKAAFDGLIRSNEDLNSSILTTQTLLVSTTRVVDGFGNEVDDLSRKFTTLEGPVRAALKETQKLTEELVGVGEIEITNAFSTIIQNSKLLQGQTQEFDSFLEAAPELTQKFSAALGTIGLPLSQVNQEFRSIVSGDVNNPDALLSKRLGITKEEVQKARDAGRLIDLLNEKLEPFIEANQLAKGGLFAIAEDLTETFAKFSRLGGEGLTASISKNIGEFRDFIRENSENIEEFADRVSVLLTSLSEAFFTLVKEVGSALPLEGLGKVVLSVTTNTIKGFTRIFELLGNIKEITTALVIGFAALFAPITAVVAATGLIATNLLGIEDPIQALSLGLADAVSFFSGGQFGIGAIRREVKDLTADTDNFVARQRGSLEILQAIQQENRIAAQQGRELNKEEAERAAQAASLLDVEVKALKERIGLLKFAREQALGDKEPTDQIDQALKRTTKLLEEFQKVQQGAQILGEPLPNLAEFGKQVEENFTAAAKSIDAAVDTGDLVQLNRALKSLKEEAQLAFDTGTIPTEDIINGLTAIANKAELNAQQQFAIQQQIVKIISQEFKQKQSVLQVETALIKGQVARGKLSNTEGRLLENEIAKKTTLLKIEEQRQILEARRLIGNQRGAEQAEQEIKRLTAELENLNVATQQIRFEGAVEKANRAFNQANVALTGSLLERQQLIEQSSTSTLDTTAELNADLLRNEEQNGLAQIALLKRRLETLKSLRSQALTQEDRRSFTEQIAQITNEITQTQLEAQRRLSQLALASDDILVDRLATTKELSELARQQVQLQERLINADRTLGETRFANERNTTREALAFAQERLNNLLTIEIPQSRAARIDLEKRIREAKAETLRASVDLLDQEAAIERELRDARRDNLREIERQSRQFALTTLNAQTQLLEARAALQDALTDALLANTNISNDQLDEAQKLRELFNSDETPQSVKKIAQERLKLLGLENKSAKDIAQIRLDNARKIADLELERLKRREELDLQSLEVERQKAKIQRELQKFDAQQNNITSQDKILELTREREQLLKDGDQRGAQLVEEQIELQRQSIGINNRRIQNIDNQAQVENAGFDLREQTIRVGSRTAQRSLVAQSNERITEAAIDAVREGVKVDLKDTLLDPIRATPSRDIRRSVDVADRSIVRNQSRLDQGQLNPAAADIKIIRRLIGDLIVKFEQQVPNQSKTVNNTVINRSVADPGAIIKLFGN